MIFNSTFIGLMQSDIPIYLDVSRWKNEYNKTADNKSYSRTLNLSIKFDNIDISQGKVIGYDVSENIIVFYYDYNDPSNNDLLNNHDISYMLLNKTRFYSNYFMKNKIYSTTLNDSTIKFYYYNTNYSNNIINLNFSYYIKKNNSSIVPDHITYYIINNIKIRDYLQLLIEESQSSTSESRHNFLLNNYLISINYISPNYNNSEILTNSSLWNINNVISDKINFANASNSYSNNNQTGDNFKFIIEISGQDMSNGKIAAISNNNNLYSLHGFANINDITNHNINYTDVSYEYSWTIQLNILLYPLDYSNVTISSEYFNSYSYNILGLDTSYHDITFYYQDNSENYIIPLEPSLRFYKYEHPDNQNIAFQELSNNMVIGPSYNIIGSQLPFLLSNNYAKQPTSYNSLPNNPIDFIYSISGVIIDGYTNIINLNNIIWDTSTINITFEDQSYGLTILNPNSNIRETYNDISLNYEKLTTNDLSYTISSDGSVDFVDFNNIELIYEVARLFEKVNYFYDNPINRLDVSNFITGRQLYEISSNSFVDKFINFAIIIAYDNSINNMFFITKNSTVATISYDITNVGTNFDLDYSNNFYTAIDPEIVYILSKPKV